ncbi:MAG: hypothetical protein WDN29_07890 [Methylovirgula sp.]
MLLAIGARRAEQKSRENTRVYQAQVAQMRCVTIGTENVYSVEHCKKRRLEIILSEENDTLPIERRRNMRLSVSNRDVDRKGFAFVRVLADGFVQFPKDREARMQLIDSGLAIQVILAAELEAMGQVLATMARAKSQGAGELN